MTTYILGAGPAGLAVADGLVDAGAGPFVVIERDAVPGGLARTVTWPGVGTHDYGPHKIFSLDAGLVARVDALLPAQDWLTRQKVSSIYLKGHYLPYPPSPFSLSGVFGLPRFLAMVAGYGVAMLRNMMGSKQPATFAEDLIGRLGGPLYESLFKPIAEKLWGDPRSLDVKLSQGRVQTPSILEVLGRALKLRRASNFEALTFRYPRGGLGRIWSAIEAKTAGHGEIRYGCQVRGMDVVDGRVTAIRCETGGVESVHAVGPDDFVASTLPLGVALRLLGPALPAGLVSLGDGVVTLNDLLLVFLHVDRSSLLDESWIFVPDPDIAFHRVSEQESFDGGMTPDGSVVCCEIMSGPHRPMGAASDAELIEVAGRGLKAMGYRDFRVRASYVVRLPRSYPVYRAGFEPGLTRILDALDGIANFRTVGRQGAFNYIGTLDAMDIGYGFARWLVGGRTAPWRDERSRTNHYPVLD